MQPPRLHPRVQQVLGVPVVHDLVALEQPLRHGFALVGQGPGEDVRDSRESEHITHCSSRMADPDDASNPRAKVSELSSKVVDTNPYSRLMCAGRLRHACCAAD